MPQTHEFRCFLEKEIEYKNKGDDYAVWLIHQVQELTKQVETLQDDNKFDTLKEHLSERIRVIHSALDDGCDQIIAEIERTNELLGEE